MTAETEIVMREHTKVVAVVCDRCGLRHAQPNWPGGVLTLQFSYGSAYDLDHHEIDLCDACAQAVLAFAREVTS